MATVVDLKTEDQRKDSVRNARGYSRKKKTVLLAAGLTVLLGAAALGIRYWLWSQTHEETDDAYIAGHIHPISSRIAGTVETVLVNDTQHVERGQVLLRLDPRDTKCAWPKRKLRSTWHVVRRLAPEQPLISQHKMPRLVLQKLTAKFAAPKRRLPRATRPSRK